MVRNATGQSGLLLTSPISGRILNITVGYPTGYRKSEKAGSPAEYAVQVQYHIVLLKSTLSSTISSQEWLVGTDLDVKL